MDHLVYSRAEGERVLTREQWLRLRLSLRLILCLPCLREAELRLHHKRHRHDRLSSTGPPAVRILVRLVVLVPAAGGRKRKL